MGQEYEEIHRLSDGVMGGQWHNGDNIGKWEMGERNGNEAKY